VRCAFCRGDLTLNVKVPTGWAGGWATCTLGALFYRGVVGLPPAYAPDAPDGGDGGGSTVRLGGGRIEKMVLPAAAAAAAAAAGGCDGADRHAAAHAVTEVAGVTAGLATITAVSKRPSPHMAAVGEAVLAAALVSADDGLPAWLVGGGWGEGEEAVEAETMGLEVTWGGGGHVGGAGGQM